MFFNFIILLWQISKPEFFFVRNKLTALYIKLQMASLAVLSQIITFAIVTVYTI